MINFSKSNSIDLNYSNYILFSLYFLRCRKQHQTKRTRKNHKQMKIISYRNRQSKEMIKSKFLDNLLILILNF